MTGYTAKVGLRKSRLHFDALRMRKIVRQVPDRDHNWLRDQISRSAATLDGLDPELREVMAHRTRARVGLHKPNRDRARHLHWWVEERDGVVRCFDCGVKR